MFNIGILIECLTMLPILSLIIEVVLTRKNSIRRYIQYYSGLVYIVFFFYVFQTQNDLYPELEKTSYLSITARNLNFNISDIRVLLTGYTLLFLLYYLFIAPNSLKRSDSNLFVSSDAIPTSMFTIIFTIFSSSLLTFFAKDFLTLFITIEIAAFSFYVMMMNKSYYGEIVSQIANFRYFIISAFSSLLFLIAIVFSYIFAGSLRFDVILKNSISYQLFYSKASPLLILSLIFLLVSFSIKLALPIFGFWAPSVYKGLDLKNFLLLSTLMKIPAVYALIKLLLGLYDNYDYIWIKFLTVLFVVGLLTIPIIMLNKNLTLREFLSYSSIYSLIPVFIPLTTNLLSDFSLSFSYYITYLFANFLLVASINYAYNSNALSVDDTTVKLKELGKFFTDNFSRIFFLLSLFLISSFPLSSLWFIKLEIFNLIKNQHLLLLIFIFSSSLLFLAYLFPGYESFKKLDSSIQTKPSLYFKIITVTIFLINILILADTNRYLQVFSHIHIVF